MSLSFGLLKASALLIICISLSVAQTTDCQNNELSCQDSKLGTVCYNPNTTSCPEDIATNLHVLCGFGLSSCKGVCFNPLFNFCNVTSGLQRVYIEDHPSSPLQTQLSPLSSTSIPKENNSQDVTSSIKSTATKITYYPPPRIPINTPIRPTVTENL
jgi:hypothetical protein